VRFIAQFVRRRGLDHGIALSICALLLVFAVTSKVAAYHPRELAARSIAATKVWQAKSMAADSEVASPSVMLLSIELVIFLSLCLVSAGPSLEREYPQSHSPMENFAALAMRPPPAF
jgi:hypothetical protein